MRSFCLFVLLVFILTPSVFAYEVDWQLYFDVLDYPENSLVSFPNGISVYRKVSNFTTGEWNEFYICHPLFSDNKFSGNIRGYNWKTGSPEPDKSLHYGLKFSFGLNVDGEYRICTLFTFYRTMSKPDPNDPYYFPTGMSIRMGNIPWDLTPPVISVYPPGQDFIDSILVTVSANEPSTIYYSLDGSFPTLVYTEPILITESVLLRVRAVDLSGNESEVISFAYTRYVPTEEEPTDPGGSEPPPYPGDKEKPEPVLNRFFHIPVSRSVILEHAIDVSRLGLPGMWLFVVAFFGFLILAFVRRVRR